MIPEQLINDCLTLSASSVSPQSDASSESKGDKVSEPSKDREYISSGMGLMNDDASSRTFRGERGERPRKIMKDFEALIFFAPDFTGVVGTDVSLGSRSVRERRTLRGGGQPVYSEAEVGHTH